MSCVAKQYSDQMACDKCNISWDTNDNHPSCGGRGKIGQKKSHSFIEVCINTTIGYIIAIATQIIVFPFFDITVSHSQNLQIGLIFTVISIVRSYIMRRVFNYIQIR